MNPAAIAPLPFGNAPFFIGALLLLAVCVSLLFIDRKEEDVGALNNEAKETLDHLIEATRDNQTARTHLQELRRIFMHLIEDHPDHELTARLRWIISENMVVLSPYYLASEEQAQEVLAQYQTQLAEVRRFIDADKFLEASKAADKPFNWEHRDYFTL